MSIKEKDSTALIIMMSDHGFRSIAGKQFPKHLRLNNICKVYFPNSNYYKMPDTITNVNFFRFLFNRLITIYSLTLFKISGSLRF